MPQRRSGSPQMRALRDLYREHDADSVARFIQADGSMRVTLWRTDEKEPVCKAVIDGGGRVLTDSLVTA